MTCEGTSTASAPSPCIHTGLHLPGPFFQLGGLSSKGAEAECPPTWSLTNQELPQAEREKGWTRAVATGARGSTKVEEDSSAIHLSRGEPSNFLSMEEVASP